MQAIRLRHRQSASGPGPQATHDRTVDHRRDRCRRAQLRRQYALGARFSTLFSAVWLSVTSDHYITVTYSAPTQACPCSVHGIDMVTVYLACKTVQSLAN